MECALTLEQSRAVAAALAEAQQAHARVVELVRVLTLGVMPAGAILVDVNTDTGVLTFRSPDAD